MQPVGGRISSLGLDAWIIVNDARFGKPLLAGPILFSSCWERVASRGAEWLHLIFPESRPPSQTVRRGLAGYAGDNFFRRSESRPRGGEIDQEWRRADKVALIETCNPYWLDLFPGLV